MDRRLKLRWSIDIGLLLALVTLSKASGADTGLLLKGTVVDPTGACIPNSRVVLYDRSVKYLIAERYANAEGKFMFGNLAPSAYTVEVSAPGFKTLRKANVELASDLSMDLRLELDFCGPTYLGKTREPYSITVLREPSFGFGADLIQLAERLPCKDGRWTKDESEGPRWPTCVTWDAVVYHKEELKRFRDRAPQDLRRSAEMYYKATARFDTGRREWIVVLRLEYNQDEGTAFGQYGFWRSRVVVFDPQGKLLRVEEKSDCDSGIIT
ncbi:MAG: carboxypeptidase-like regulatory domain-containing protein [Acidobacteriia bacterium]|nr:carboxypeptidase-like regulatory domain-containing protein [Terriglobia bacterium]